MIPRGNPPNSTTTQRHPSSRRAENSSIQTRSRSTGRSFAPSFLGFRAIVTQVDLHQCKQLNQNNRFLRFSCPLPGSREAESPRHRQNALGSDMRSHTCCAALRPSGAWPARGRRWALRHPASWSAPLSHLRDNRNPELSGERRSARVQLCDSRDLVCNSERRR